MHTYETLFYQCYRTTAWHERDCVKKAGQKHMLVCMHLIATWVRRGKQPIETPHTKRSINRCQSTSYIITSFRDTRFWQRILGTSSPSTHHTCVIHSYTRRKDANCCIMMQSRGFAVGSTVFSTENARRHGLIDQPTTQQATIRVKRNSDTACNVDRFCEPHHSPSFRGIYFGSWLVTTKHIFTSVEPVRIFEGILSTENSLKSPKSSAPRRIYARGEPCLPALPLSATTQKIHEPYRTSFHFRLRVRRRDDQIGALRTTT